MKLFYPALLVSLLSASAAHAVTYAWTGDAGDGSWTNTANWDVNGVPVDNSGDNGLSLHRTNDLVVFGGSTMPTSNIPGIGGRNGTNIDTPTLVFNSGGTIALSAGVGGIGGLISNQVSMTRTVFTVGDGVSGGSEDVVLNLGVNGALIRHDRNVTHNFLVNGDGTLNFTGNLDFSSELAPSPRPRFSTLTINDGAVNVAGTVTDLTGTAAANNLVNFTGFGGSFTADFGADFADYSAVASSIGVDFLKASGPSLRAFNNGNGTFTVRIPEPSRSVLLLVGVGLLVGHRGRRI